MILPRSRGLLIAVVSLALAALGGCRSTFDSRFTWRPGLVDVPLGPDPAATDVPDGRVLASIVGLRRADADAGTPASIDVGLLVQNDTDRVLRIEIEAMELVAENLERFPEPRIVPGGPLEIAGGANSTVSVRFEFPREGYPGPYDLSALNLRWRLGVDGVPVMRSATFERSVRRAPSAWSNDPYWRYGSRRYAPYGRRGPWCD